MKQAIGLAAAVLLAACGNDKPKEGLQIDGDSVTATATDADGKTAAARFGGGDNGIAPPENLPAFAAIYPGATVQSTVTGEEGEAKGMVTFVTPAKMADVVAFYKDRGKAAGMSVKAETAMGDARMLVLGGASNSALQITVSPAGEDGKAMVALIYDAGKPG